MTEADLPRLRLVRAVRIHCPIAPETFAALAKGQLGVIETDPVAAAILAMIRQDNELGDFGLYRNVFEISLGLEGFTPTPAASPTLGAADANTLSPTAVITTYVAAEVPDARLSALLAELAGRHPWQIPVIEIGEVRLWR